jgi:hypothetical protein
MMHVTSENFVEPVSLPQLIKASSGREQFVTRGNSPASTIDANLTTSRDPHRTCLRPFLSSMTIDSHGLSCVILTAFCRLDRICRSRLFVKDLDLADLLWSYSCLAGGPRRGSSIASTSALVRRQLAFAVRCTNHHESVSSELGRPRLQQRSHLC